MVLVPVGLGCCVGGATVVNGDIQNDGTMTVTNGSTLVPNGNFINNGTLTVVTSFPKELTETYKKAFEAKNPGMKVEILNKNTTAGIAFVRETAVGSRPDVFWASAPDAFEVLKAKKLLAPYKSKATGISAQPSRV